MRLTAEQEAQMLEVLHEVSVIKARLDAAEIPARAVALRADILPDLGSILGLPRVRTPETDPVRWGILV